MEDPLPQRRRPLLRAAPQRGIRWDLIAVSDEEDVIRAHACQMVPCCVTLGVLALPVVRPLRELTDFHKGDPVSERGKPFPVLCVPQGLGDAAVGHASFRYDRSMHLSGEMVQS